MSSLHVFPIFVGVSSSSDLQSPFTPRINCMDGWIILIFIGQSKEKKIFIRSILAESTITL